METEKDFVDSTAMPAIRWLAGRCDYAQSLDGMGFSGVDAPLGHALALKEVWSRRETLAAYRFLVKYQKQLKCSIYNFSRLPDKIKALEKTIGSRNGLRRRDMVSGTIIVEKGKIVLSSGYNKELVGDTRELLGAEWHPNDKKWTCDLCAENAMAVEEIAQKYGLALKKHEGWQTLMPTRRVRITHNRLLVEGVNAGRIRKSLPELQGVPQEDEKEFRAIEIIDKRTIALPLTSWVIRDTLLWLATGDDDNQQRLSWAHDDIQRELGAAYQQSVVRERALFQRASAIEMAGGFSEITVPAQVADNLMPHQWVAIQALIENSQVILADQQGLGKTIEILVALEATKAFPAIILTPATALLNWRDEIAAWLPHRKVAVQGGGVGKNDQGVNLTDAEIIVVNYETFSRIKESLSALKPLALIADEAQYLKGYKSERTQAVKQFCQSNSVSRVIAATGTPVMNRPSELLTLLTFLPDMLLELGGFAYFAARYCRATSRNTGGSEFLDLSGADNLGELANRVRETGRFIRRDKASVLPQLRQKQIEEVAVEISNRGEYQQAVDYFQEWLKTHNRGKLRSRRKRDADQDDDTTVLREAVGWLGWEEGDIRNLWLDSRDRVEALRQITALRQLAGVGKISAAVVSIRNIVKDEKLVVFAHHNEVQQALVAALSADGLPTLAINGEMAAKARREVIHRFQNDPAARLIICSLKAAQTAITLTAARRALMVELDWTPSALEQAEDRIHRIGQSNQVVITYLVAANTLDDRMKSILEKKRTIIAALAATNAAFGYRKDGIPRKQLPGTGRPRLAPDTRAARRKESKAGWQACHPEYMRDYMRKRRHEESVKDVKQAREVLAYLELGYEAVHRAYGQGFRLSDYTEELADAKDNLARAQKKLKRAENNLAGLN